MSRIAKIWIVLIVLGCARTAFVYANEDPDVKAHRIRAKAAERAQVEQYHADVRREKEEARAERAAGAAERNAENARLQALLDKREAAERAQQSRENQAIQFCRDSLFDRYIATGGIGYGMNSAAYLKKGYGALVVGNATANSGPIRFKCTFDDRSGTRTLAGIQVTAR